MIKKEQGIWVEVQSSGRANPANANSESDSLCLVP